jgi:sulfate transport system permease protein
VSTATRGSAPVALALRGSFAAWVAFLVVLPLVAVVARALRDGAGALFGALVAPDALHALILTFGLSAFVVVFDVVFGVAVAWALVRWEFPGRRTLAALVDLPFSVPTLVAGMLVVALLGPQTWLGGGLSSIGIDVVFAWPGMVLALCFVTLPFVVRAVEPVLEEFDPAEEEAARLLGASPTQVVTKILLPPLVPAIATGAAQSFARAVGEFGAMAVLSGNVPRETLVASVYVLGEVEAGETPAAAAVALVLLGVAVAVQVVGFRARRRVGADR